jgi:dihydropteroate synthase
MFTLRNKERTLCVDKPLVMGILNSTPDSFYKDSRFMQTEQLVRQAAQMLEQGAALLDIGGQSTRPGSDRVSAEEEWNRIKNAISELTRRFPQAFLSVDTYHGEVARRALEAGVFMINDISAGEMDPTMIGVVAAAQAPYVIMHMRGNPTTMQENTHYQQVTKEVVHYLQTRVTDCVQAGISDIVIDPGIGFSKTIDQNFQLLSELEQFSVIKRPLLLGVSRKSFIYKTLGITPEQALNGSTFMHAIGLQKGALLLRVHDVKEAVEAVRLHEKLH